MANKKILITGGAGFIGSHLAEVLIKKKKEVYIIDNLSTGKLENIDSIKNHPQLHLTIDTIMNETIIEKLVSNCDLIYHLAAAVGVKYILSHPLETLETNIKGTELILYYANKYKKKVFIASSSEIYGKNTKCPFKETADKILGSTYISRWGYAASKAIDEFLALAYFKEKQLLVVIGRFFNTCGPRQREEYGMVIPRFIKQALKGKTITVFGTGEQSRCFGYVIDVVEEIIKLMENSNSYGKIFNIGNDEEITIKELALKIKKMTNSQSEIIYLPYEKVYGKDFEDMQRRVPDLTEIKKVINYKTKTCLDEILKETIKYFKEKFKEKDAKKVSMSSS